MEVRKSRRKSEAFDSVPESRKSGRFSIFNKNTIAFAPNDYDAETDKVNEISQTSTQARRATYTGRNSKRKSLGGSFVNQDAFKSIQRALAVSQNSKMPLSRPYKNHWAAIEERRNKRDYVYGKDDNYDFAEHDKRVKTPCCGVLAFHVIELLDLTVNKQSFMDNVPVSFYCLVSVGSIRRCTKIIHARNSQQIRMDSNLHFSIEVSEWREAPCNRLRLELWSFQDPEEHFIVGTVEIHIYQFIRLQHQIASVHLSSDGIKVGQLAYEVAFSYGAFGYGHSNQLKNFSQSLMETISHSMFPRVKLDERLDLADKSFQARCPQKLKMFTYHSLILEVNDKNPDIAAFFGRTKDRSRVAHVDLEPKPMVVQQVEFDQGFPVHCKLHMNIWQKVMQADFNDMYGEYVCIGHKRERLEYLTNLVQGRLRDVFEKEAGTVFHQLKPQELQIINKKDNIPGQLLYPNKIPCPYSAPYTLQPEDELFQEGFPTVRRESGYLAKLFGYEKKPNSNSFLNEMDYPITEVLAVTKNKNVSVEAVVGSSRDFFKNTVLKIKAALMKAYYYVFPEPIYEGIPEISISVATPEGSTTNIYSYFTREMRDVGAPGGGKVEKLVKQTTALIDMSRKTGTSGKSKGDGNGSTDSDSSDPDKVD